MVLGPLISTSPVKPFPYGSSSRVVGSTILTIVLAKGIPTLPIALVPSTWVETFEAAAYSLNP